MVWRCPPNILVEQLDPAELFQCKAAPIVRRTDAPKTAPALSAVLIAEYPQLSLCIPPEPVRAQEPTPAVIDGRHGPPSRNCCPNQPVDFFDRLGLRRADAHHLHCTRTRVSHEVKPLIEIFPRTSADLSQESAR